MSNKKVLNVKVFLEKVLNKKVKFFLTLFFITQVFSQDVFAMKSIQIIENVENKDINTVNDNGWPKLCLACYAKNNKKVKSLVEKLVESGQIESLNKTNIHKETPLYLACMGNNLDIMQYLVQKGADLKKSNMAQGNNELPTILSVACDNENTDIFEFLVQKGADKRDINAFCVACKKNNLKLVDCFFDKSFDKSIYINSQNCICIDELESIDINAYDNEGQTPLCIACKNKNLDLVKFLIKHGADANRAGKQGQIPLCIACINNDLQMVKLLLASGAQTSIGLVNKPYQGTALFFAHENGNIEIMNCLIEKGININFEFYEACCGGSLAFVQYLVEKLGANVNVTFDDGFTPIDLAVQNRCFRIANFLQEKCGQN